MKNKKKSGWLKMDDQQRLEVLSFCDPYIDFLNICKTERETIMEIENVLRRNGFVNINEKTNLEFGDRVFFVNNKKSIYCAVIGEDPITDGTLIIGSHVDSPRLDLKPNAIYEDNNLALFETHYYGGIKKYHWPAIPLAIHGVIYNKNNECLTINIGEDKHDPTFTITDLLPHLSKKQNDKKLSEAIEGEDLNILIGSIPLNDKEGSVKQNILNILEEKYQIDEDSFLSAELEIVPAFPAKSLGFDYSMVAGYGQDDRVCAYTSLQALLEIKYPKKTAIGMFVDKEEIGSMGNTGMMSEAFDLFVTELLDRKYELTANALLKTFFNSKMLSADVGAGIDPTFHSAFEKTNASHIGYGVEINKYTGSRGKSGASDANAEYVNSVKTILKENNISYQFAEFGKVDLGGGGTIAYILANKGINVLDCGIPVISMHSPYEITSKFDIYSAYLAYKAFIQQ